MYHAQLFADVVIIYYAVALSVDVKFCTLVRVFKHATPAVL